PSGNPGHGRCPPEPRSSDLLLCHAHALPCRGHHPPSGIHRSPDRRIWRPRYHLDRLNGEPAKPAKRTTRAKQRAATRSAQARATARPWIDAWSEPELAQTLRDLEYRINAILTATAATLFPDQTEDPRFPGLITGAVSLIRGLVMDIPIAGRQVVNDRWELIKPILLESAAQLLDHPAPARRSAG